MGKWPTWWSLSFVTVVRGQALMAYADASLCKLQKPKNTHADHTESLLKQIPEATSRGCGSVVGVRSEACIYPAPTLAEAAGRRTTPALLAVSTCIRVSQPGHFCYLGLDNHLLWAACAFSHIPGLNPVDTSSTFYNNNLKCQLPPAP